METYDNYAAFLLECGEPPAKVAAIVAERRRVAACLDAGACPHCRTKLDVRTDPRQAGAKPEGTTWVNYRGPGCRFMLDRAESQV